jgi:ATP adenylyltransferase
VLNRYPYSNGHLLIAPYEHEGDLEKLPEETLLELMTVVRDAKRTLTAACSPDAFNIGANLGKDAGAGVADHLHLHIVPRWRGDTNFMPVIADTKVIPQALGELCERLRSQWKASPPERG